MSCTNACTAPISQLYSFIFPWNVTHNRQVFAALFSEVCPFPLSPPLETAAVTYHSWKGKGGTKFSARTWIMSCPSARVLVTVGISTYIWVKIHTGEWKQQEELVYILPVYVIDEFSEDFKAVLLRSVNTSLYLSVFLKEGGNNKIYSIVEKKFW